MRVLSTALACGFSGSILIMTLLVLLVPVFEDEKTISGRARLNAWLLVPFCALGPAGVWALLAMVTDPQVSPAPVGPTWEAWMAWTHWSGVRWLASPAGAVVIATLAVGWAGWTQLSTRRWMTSGRCIGCGYPLMGLSEPRCPECGRRAFPGQRIEPMNPPSPRPR
jgi:hypothetical protein